MNQPTGNDVVTLRGGALIDGDGEPQSEFDPSQLGMDELPPDIALQNVYAQIDADERPSAKVYAYKVDTKTNQKGYIGSFSVEEFAADGLDQLRNAYGAGKYHIRVMNGNRVLTHKIVSLLEPMNRPTAAPQVDIAGILAQQQQTMLAGFQEIMRVNQQPAPQQAMGINEVLSLITTLQPLLGGRGESAAAPTDPLAMMRMVLDMSKELKSGGDGGDDSDIGLLSKAIDVFGKPLAELVSKSQAASAAAPTRATLPAIVQQTAPIPDPQPTPEDQEMGIMLHVYKKLILTAAASDADPATYAALVLDHFTAQQINEFFVKPTWFEELRGTIPECGTYQPWFEELRTVILDMLREAGNSVSVAGKLTPTPPNVPQ